MRPRLSQTELRRVAKMAIAASLAWAIGVAAGQSAPVFAALVPLLAIKDDPYSGLNVSADRVIGVLAGVALGVAALQVSQPTLLMAIAVIVIGLAAGIPLRVRGEVNVQVAVSAMIMLLVSSQATAVGITRIWETLMGVVVTFVVSIVLWPPDPLRSLREAEAVTRATVASDLLATVGLLGTPGDFEANLDRLRDHAESAAGLPDDLARARRGLRLNPRHHSERPALDALAPRFDALARGERHVRSLARLFTDLAAEGRPPQAGSALPTIEEAAAHLADALRGIGDGANAEIATAADSVERIEYEPDNPVAVLCQAELRRLVADLAGLTHPAPVPAV